MKGYTGTIRPLHKNGNQNTCLKSIQGLDPDKFYIFQFSEESRSMDLLYFMQEMKVQGIKGICVISRNSNGFKIMEPVGIDKEKLKELFR